MGFKFPIPDMLHSKALWEFAVKLEEPTTSVVELEELKMFLRKYAVSESAKSPE